MYGWRAYALPVLSVLTIAAVVRMAPTSAAHPARSRDLHAAAVTAAANSASHRPALAVGATWRPASTPSAQLIALPDDISSCAQNRYSQLILVSLSQQHLWACEGHRQVGETPVTTGRTDNGDQTPVGSWRVQAKQRDRYLVGPGYRDYVKYWMPFNGDFGLHDAAWQTMPFGSAGYHSGGSHGCVHVPTRMMAWLYHWAEVGRTVVTVEN